jgi:hypothetical protein
VAPAPVQAKSEPCSRSRQETKSWRTQSPYGVRGTGKHFGVYGNGNTGVFGVGTLSGFAGSGSRFGVVGGGDTGIHGNGVHDGVRGDGGYAGIIGRGGTVGVWGSSTLGVRGEGVAQGVVATGNVALYGRGTSYGVYGKGGSAAAIYGDNPSGQAGYFQGNVYVEGAFGHSLGALQIDHPQDPANKTLAHASVEAPEMLNVYRANVILDASGRTTVRLPRYFKALNADYSYQLTAIGAPAPDLHVARKVNGNRFSIAGGAPGQEVCWIVTGVRQDAWAKANPLRVERPKKRKDRGTYLNPKAHGQPRSAAIHQPPKVRRLRQRRERRSAG